VSPRTAELLDGALEFVRDYVVLPSDEEGVALAAWVLHSWASDAGHATPYLIVSSPERRTGKTRLLEVLELLVRAPWRVTSTSEAALFRKLSQDHPTLLLDEIDAVFASPTERTEPLRAILNCGNRPGSSVARCVGDGGKMRVADFDVFGPKVLSGIDSGRIPTTVRDRSVEIRMQRKTSAEVVRRFRHRKADVEAADLRAGLEEWAAEHHEELLAAEPELPEGLNDRAAEAWEPLFAIADVAGGEWPARIRGAALTLAAGADADEASHGTRLLAAVRTAFAGQESISSAGLVKAINGDDEAPFGAWRDGRGLDARLLAKLLKPYGVRPGTVRLGDTTAKGYRREQLAEPWTRYLDEPDPQHGADASPRIPLHERDVTDVTDVTAISEGGAEWPATDDEEAEADRIRAKLEVAS
jgi:hypothetical protein